ncbi:MAG TPA: translation elongation factor-like protein [bacterium]|jgi:putative protease|nr:translation elongation factor-like protein [bacterium]HOV97554.1 translation elongation factor-like protein [bacterium]HQK41451.1 translation elongation factor-like protein [bacterium]
MAEKKIGTITHFFDNISVGIIKLEGDIKIGDRVRFQGATTNFEQEITSMQYEHENIESAKKGQEVGVKTNEKVREGDDVYLLE